MGAPHKSDKLLRYFKSHPGQKIKATTLQHAVNQGAIGTARLLIRAGHPITEARKHKLRGLYFIYNKPTTEEEMKPSAPGAAKVLKYLQARPGQKIRAIDLKKAVGEGITDSLNKAIARGEVVKYPVGPREVYYEWIADSAPAAIEPLRKDVPLEIPSETLLFCFRTAEGHEAHFTTEQARSLYDSLKAVFG